jgi:RNA polymerase sigma-70 factor (ECF subfamily)
MSNELDATLERVIALVLGGDRSAFRYLVEAYLPAVRSFVAARSLPGIDVDEVVQKSFIEAYQGLAGFRIGTDFRAWVLTIARYQIMMESTKLRRLADYHSRYIPYALAKESERRLQESPPEYDRLKYLQDCLTTVSDSNRQLLKARYEDGFDIQAIADRLGRSAGAVRKQLCLLRKQLHDCIERKVAQVTIG